MKKLLLSALILLCCFAQASAWMNVTTVGGGVPAAAASYGVGNLLSERFTADEYDNSWAEVTQGDGAVNGNDTSVTGTGFVGQHLTASGTTNFEANAGTDIGEQSAVYFRFFYVMNSESWEDGASENIFTLAPNGGNITNNTYLNITVRQSSGQLQLRFVAVAGTGISTGSETYNISTGRIYKIEGKVVDEGETGSAEVKIYGVSAVTFDNKAGLGTVAIQDVLIGISYNSAASSHSFDTLDISSTGYLVDS